MIEVRMDFQSIVKFLSYFKIVSRSISRQLVVDHKYYNNAGRLVRPFVSDHSFWSRFRLLFRIPTSCFFVASARNQSIVMRTHKFVSEIIYNTRTLYTRVGGRKFVTATGMHVRFA